MIHTEPIGTMRRVFFGNGAYIAALTGMANEDLAYNSDTLILYRYNGAAWVAITIYSGSGLIGGRLAAGNYPNGSLYYATDTGILSQVQTGAWVNITAAWANATTGIYTGNSTANRAIAHGLGLIPKVVIIERNDSPFGHAHIISNIALVYYHIAGADAITVVTAADTTNFYVGNNPAYTDAMNLSAATYKWTAIG